MRSQFTNSINLRVLYTDYCIIGPAIFDYNKWLILLSVIPLSGGHCIEEDNLYQSFEASYKPAISASPLERNDKLQIKNFFLWNVFLQNEVKLCIFDSICKKSGGKSSTLMQINLHISGTKTLSWKKINSVGLFLRRNVNNLKPGFYLME